MDMLGQLIEDTAYLRPTYYQVLSIVNQNNLVMLRSRFSMALEGCVCIDNCHSRLLSKPHYSELGHYSNMDM